MSSTCRGFGARAIGGDYRYGRCGFQHDDLDVEALRHEEQRSRGGYTVLPAKTAHVDSRRALLLLLRRKQALRRALKHHLMAQHHARVACFRGGDCSAKSRAHQVRHHHEICALQCLHLAVASDVPSVLQPKLLHAAGRQAAPLSARPVSKEKAMSQSAPRSPWHRVSGENHPLEARP